MKKYLKPSVLFVELASDVVLASGNVGYNWGDDNFNDSEL